MMVLCCTRRLLDCFDEKPSVEVRPEPRDSLLGCWYANMVWYGSTPLALCVNELTRYAIVILLDDCKSVSDLHTRATQRIHDMVLRLAAAPAVARRVFDEYRGGVRIVPTRNRSILGTMNDLAFHLEWSLDHHLQAGPVRDITVVEKDLNVIPQRTLDWSNARDRLIAVCRASIE